MSSFLCIWYQSWIEHIPSLPLLYTYNHHKTPPSPRQPPPPQQTPSPDLFLQSLIQKSSPSIPKTSRCLWMCSFNQEVTGRFKSQATRSQATSGSALVSSRLQIQKFDFFSDELLLRPLVSDLLVSSPFRSRLRSNLCLLPQ
ncbi:hypothetical protein AKJ16_DCAP20030 [Drosera capensis]